MLSEIVGCALVSPWELHSATDARERENTRRQKIPPICGRVSVGQSRPVKRKWLRCTATKLGIAKYAYKYT